MGQKQSVDYAIVVGDETVGAVSLRGDETLAEVRREIDADGIAGVPPDFQFVLPNGAPVSATQESKRTASDTSNGGMTLTLKGGPLDDLRGSLCPLHHLDDALIKEQVRRFAPGTRQWAFDKFDEWVSGGRDDPHRVFVLAGQAGVGKTGIMCKLASDRRDVVAARHFCRHDDARRSNPRAMLTSIAYQLAISCPEYGRRLGAHVKAHKLTRAKLMGDEYDTVTIFTELLQNLLTDLDVETTTMRKVILIDAIDECDHGGGGDRNGVLECIRKYFRQLPPWLGVFITTRPEVPIKEKLRLFNPIQIDPGMEDNLTDLRTFFSSLLDEDGVRDRLRGVNKAHAVETLVQKSQGLFIYAVMTAESIRENKNEAVTQSVMDSFPDGLDGFYLEQMERSFPNIEGSLAWDIVKLVTVAVEPLSIDFVQALVGSTEVQCRAALLELSRFFPVHGHRIFSFHKSLNDWLVSHERLESQYYIKLEDAEKKLAEGCIRVLKESGILSGQKAGVWPGITNMPMLYYPLKHGVEHLCSVAMRDEARRLIFDVGWLFARSRDSLGVAEDCNKLGKDDRAVELLGKAVSLAQNAMRHDSRQLPGQLVGRLLGSTLKAGMEAENVRLELNDFLQRLKLYDYGFSWWCPITMTWDSADTPCLRVLVGHSNSVRCVHWSHNGKWIASGSSDGAVRTWDATTGDRIHHIKGFHGSGKVNSVSWSHDDKLIACACTGWGRVRIFDSSTGELAHSLQHGKSLGLRTISWSPDDLHVASEYKTCILIWNVSTGKCMYEEQAGGGTVNCVRWSRGGGSLVAAVGTYVRIFMLDSETGLRLVRTFEGHASRINAVDWSHDDKKILSCSDDFKITLWNVGNGLCLHQMEGRYAVFSHSDKAVVTASRYNTVRVWDIETGEYTHLLKGHTSPVLSVATAPNDMTIASGAADHTIRLWDITSSFRAPIIEGHSDYITSETWSHDGRHAVTASVDKSLRVWDANTGKTINVLRGHSGRIMCVLCSHGIANTGIIASGSSDKSVRLWQLLDGSVLHVLKGHAGNVRSLAWAHDDLSLASGATDGAIRIWDVTSGQNTRKLQCGNGMTSTIRSILFSPDGQNLASASVAPDDATTIHCWDLTKTNCTKITKARPNGWLVAFSDDGRRVLLSSYEKDIDVINLDSGDCEVVGLSELPVELPRLHFAAGSMALSSFLALYEGTVLADARRFRVFGQKAFGVSGNTISFFSLFERTRCRSEGNKISFLQSDPLVYRNDESKFHPMPRLNFDRERELMRQCLMDASRGVEISFRAATTKALQDAVISRASCVHFSGHGAPSYLIVEDGKGGAHFLDDAMLGELYPQDCAAGPPHKLVFISACYSAYLAEVFIKAGVDHVVCCQHDAELADVAAGIFMKTFYMALIVGHTVKASYEMGRQAVASGPFVLNSEEEKKKFMLLPEDRAHDETIFFARPLPEWAGSVLPQQWLPGIMSVDEGARQVDMYHLLHKILQHRFVSVIGIGADTRRAIAAATCHYISDRRSTTEIDLDVVLYLHAQQLACGEESCAQYLYRQLVSADCTSADNKIVTFGYLVNLLQKTRALLFIDEDESECTIRSVVRRLIIETNHVKILRTASKPLEDVYVGIREEVYEL